jgi:hypothetical protein
VGDNRAFRGLYEDTAGAFEGHLERLPGAVAGEDLERDVAPEAGTDVAAPLEDHVEEAAGEPARALDPLDVPADALLDSQDAVPLTAICSFPRSRIMFLRLSCARNRSPVPAAVISLTPSPVRPS